MILLQTNTFDLIPADEHALRKKIEARFVIALDFDGVISNPYALKAQYLKERGYNLAEEQSSPLSCLKAGVSKEDHEYATNRAFTTKPQDLPLEQGFLTAYQELQKLAVAVIIVTSRLDDMLDHLRAYLKHYAIHVDGIVNTKNRSKTEMLRKLQARVFIDDSPFKLLQIVKEYPTITKECNLILYRNVQNRRERVPGPEMIEVKGWNELLAVLTKMVTTSHESKSI